MLQKVFRICQTSAAGHFVCVCVYCTMAETTGCVLGSHIFYRLVSKAIGFVTASGIWPKIVYARVRVCVYKLSIEPHLFSQSPRFLYAFYMIIYYPVECAVARYARVV